MCSRPRSRLATGRTDQFQEHFQAAAVAAHDYPALEVAVLGEAVAASSVLSDFQRVLLWAEQARQILDEHPRMDRAATDAGWAVTACLTGDPSGAGAVLDALADGSLISAIATGPPALAVWTAVAAYHVAMMVERFEESRESFEAGWSRAQKVGAPMLITYMGIGYVDIQCRQGRLADARQLIRSMEEVNLRSGVACRWSPDYRRP